jgi:hypothetical protein
MNSKAKALSTYTSPHDSSSNTGGGLSSLIKANHSPAGQMDIYEVLASIAAEAGGA